MANLSIGRLSLDLPAPWDRGGEDLARTIAQRLASSTATKGPRAVDAMQVAVTAGPEDSKDALVEQIVAEILRRIERES